MDGVLLGLVDHVGTFCRHVHRKDFPRAHDPFGNSRRNVCTDVFILLCAQRFGLSGHQNAAHRRARSKTCARLEEGCRQLRRSGLSE